MIAGEMFDLLNLVLELVKSKAELDKAYFEHFVEPIWESFNKVHNDYMSSLQEYTEIVSKDDTSIDALIQKINRDSVYTDHIRSELFALICQTPPAQLKVKSSYVSNFLGEVASYLTNRKALITGRLLPEDGYFLFGPNQAIRIPLVVYLLRRKEETNKHQAAQFFTKVAKDLQSMYQRVSKSYYHLKQALLTE